MFKGLKKRHPWQVFMRWYFTNCMGLCRIDETNEQERSVGKGAGIALSICYDMIQQMNGRLWVETEPTKGTTFYNSLPQ